jgi:hypothetical protein
MGRSELSIAELDIVEVEQITRYTDSFYDYTIHDESS